MFNTLKRRPILIHNQPSSIRLASNLLMMVLALVVLMASESHAQDASSRQALERLEMVMDQQEELTEDEVKLYLQHVNDIYRLRFEPDRLNETVRLINQWSEKRFAYVTTKMAAGMSILMKPGDPRNNSIPQFARPTSGELALIKRYQDQLDEAMTHAMRQFSPPASSN